MSMFPASSTARLEVAQHWEGRDVTTTLGFTAVGARKCFPGSIQMSPLPSPSLLWESIKPLAESFCHQSP